MTRTVRVRPEAEADLAEAYAWYEQRSEGLGAEFLSAYELALGGIGRFPEGYPVVHREMRRALLRRFPYGILYVIADQTIDILACMHTARDPRRWKRRA